MNTHNIYQFSCNCIQNTMQVTYYSNWKSKQFFSRVISMIYVKKHIFYFFIFFKSQKSFKHPGNRQRGRINIFLLMEIFKALDIHPVVLGMKNMVTSRNANFDAWSKDQFYSQLNMHYTIRRNFSRASHWYMVCPWDISSHYRMQKKFREILLGKIE